MQAQYVMEWESPLGLEIEEFADSNSPMKTFSQFDINMHPHRLMESEPFFAHLSRRVDKRADEGIPTAGVRINPDTCFYEMVYNPTYRTIFLIFIA